MANACPMRISLFAIYVSGITRVHYSDNADIPYSILYSLYSTASRSAAAAVVAVVAAAVEQQQWGVRQKLKQGDAMQLPHHQLVKNSKKFGHLACCSGIP